MTNEFIKQKVLVAVGVIGTVIVSLLGGWDTAMQTLIFLMVVDYLTGMIVSGVFHASPKTNGGAISSCAGWAGLVRKGVVLVLVMVATQLDIILATQFIRIGVVLPFIVNELVSIIENAGLMGIPIPKALRDAIELLNNDDEDEEGGQ